MQDVYVEYEPKGIEFAAMDANDDGVEANEKGLPISANPHPSNTRLHTAWNDGWNTQQAVREDWTSVCSCPSGDGSLRWPCAVHP